MLISASGFSQDLILTQFREGYIFKNGSLPFLSPWKTFNPYTRPRINIQPMDGEGKNFRLQFYLLYDGILPVNDLKVEYIGKTNTNEGDVYIYRDTKGEFEIWVLNSWLGYLARNSWLLYKITTLSLVYPDENGLQILIFQ